MPEQAQIVALRAGNLRGTAICSCVQKGQMLDFYPRGFYTGKYDGVFQRSPVDLETLAVRTKGGDSQRKSECEGWGQTYPAR
jgi:hypothetical protein